MFLQKKEVANHAQDGSYHPRLVNEYSCDNCNTYIHESYPHVKVQGIHLCWDCGFITGKLTEKDFLKHCPIYLASIRAYVEDGQIKYTTSKRTPEERKDNDRNYPEYVEWRKAVFERDNYTCQRCKVRGGKLNAHHILSFKKYPKYRTYLKNGITLCVECHKHVHRKWK